MAILDINDIRTILPHRYPFLLVDRIVELEPERIVGIKNVTDNEPFFTGHFPDFPVMPGVLIVEAMAQTAGVLVLKSIPDRQNKLVLLVAVENARFRRPVVPGRHAAHGNEGHQAQGQRGQNGGRGHGGRRGGGRSRSHVQARRQGREAGRRSDVLTMAIHPTAIVDPRARVAESAEIGPYCDRRRGGRNRRAHAPDGPHLTWKAPPGSAKITSSSRTAPSAWRRRI